MDFQPNAPIYLQIVNLFKKQILSGVYPPGSAVPSRRETAALYQVNPNTVQRAYSELEAEGLIRTLRGQGSVVTEDETVLYKLRESFVQQTIARFVGEMEEIGIERSELAELVTQFIKEGKPHD